MMETFHAGTTDIHTRSFSNWIKSFKDLYLVCVVTCLFRHLKLTLFYEIYFPPFTIILYGKWHQITTLSTPGFSEATYGSRGWLGLSVPFSSMDIELSALP